MSCIKTEYHEIKVYCPLLPLLIKEWKTFDHLCWYLSPKFHCHGGDQDGLGRKLFFPMMVWGLRYPKNCLVSIWKKRMKTHHFKMYSSTWNSKITPLTHKFIFQTFMFRFHVSFHRCSSSWLFKKRPFLKWY